MSLTFIVLLVYWTWAGEIDLLWWVMMSWGTHRTCCKSEEQDVFFSRNVIIRYEILYLYWKFFDLNIFKTLNIKNVKNEEIQKHYAVRTVLFGNNRNDEQINDSCWQVNFGSNDANNNMIVIPVNSLQGLQLYSQILFSYLQQQQIRVLAWMKFLRSISH